MNTQKIRQKYRQIRRLLPFEQQITNALLINKKLNHYLRFSSQLKVAAYSAVQGEISLNPWITGNQRQQVFLPKLYEVIAPQLRFAALTRETVWTKNRFKIPEPDANWSRCLHARQLDVVFVPLVAFDRTGYRLGMGGGYYDRSLAFRRSRQKWLSPELIGVAHSCQEHPGLPHQDWDIPLDAIITEKEIIIPHKTK